MNKECKQCLMRHAPSVTCESHRALTAVKLANDSNTLLQALLDLERAKTATLLTVNMPLAVMQARIHQQNREMGWWDNPREMGTLLCLVHSEISEAMEGERKGLMDDHLPHRPMLEVELADAMIRIMDIAASRDLDLAGAIVEKVDYNRKRVDHQPGARAGTYGKKF